MAEVSLFKKISLLPDSLRKEAEDFIDFLISKANQPKEKKKKRKLGLAKDWIKLKKNFDDPIDDFKEYM